ncbi:putative bifunctional diguanylate cyclase/phosphodiesterase [Robertmurraya sp. GLU-23]
MFESIPILFDRISEDYKLYEMENDLRIAMEREEFILHYQPRVDTYTGEIKGAEALIRWNHPKWGMISPIEFIPMAEERGLIDEMSVWILQKVCRLLTKWEKVGVNCVPIFINLSAKTLKRADFIPTVIKHLKEYRVSPSLLEIEITENSMLEMDEAVFSNIEMLKDLGISISIDDFGTGFTSITHLKKLKVQFIKIDRSFINTMLENPEDSIIVECIHFLAKGFNLRVVAEGVETIEQWELLRNMNCHFIQGYLFSKPLEEKQFEYVISKETGLSLSTK